MLTAAINDGSDLSLAAFVWRCAGQSFYPDGVVPTEGEVRKLVSRRDHAQEVERPRARVSPPPRAQGVGAMFALIISRQVRIMGAQMHWVPSEVVGPFEDEAEATQVGEELRMRCAHLAAHEAYEVVPSTAPATYLQSH
jgi:hypothetical protein